MGVPFRHRVAGRSERLDKLTAAFEDGCWLHATGGRFGNQRAIAFIPREAQLWNRGRLAHDSPSPPSERDEALAPELFVRTIDGVHIDSQFGGELSGGRQPGSGLKGAAT